MARRRGTPALRADFTGPFFERDPRKTLEENVRQMMTGVAREGQRLVKGQIAARMGRMPRSTGHTLRRVEGRVTSLRGKRWRSTAVVSMATGGMGRRQAIRTQAAAASIERRFHVFRRTRTAMRRAARIHAARLTEGLN